MAPKTRSSYGSYGGKSTVFVALWGPQTCQGEPFWVHPHGILAQIPEKYER